jgi:hypothetical protein
VLHSSGYSDTTGPELGSKVPPSLELPWHGFLGGSGPVSVVDSVKASSSLWYPEELACSLITLRFFFLSDLWPDVASRFDMLFSFLFDANEINKKE